MISYMMRVPDWTPEQVTDWFLGLDDTLRSYAHAFLNNDIDGRHLVILCSDDLNSLNIWKLGHQELILEAVEHLGQSYFHLDAENLQWLALRLSCKARSLYNELPAPLSNNSAEDDDDDDHKQKRKIRDHVATRTLFAVADVVASIKSLMCWLDGPPFEGQEQYSSMRTTLLQLGVELATNAQRDKFAEEPNTVIRNICHRIATMCDELIQESRDPLILQPASLDIATVRKKPNEELGMHIQSLYSGSHVIGRVKYQSPASSGGRVERGDEIVQVNYRTVVGWTLKKLVLAMKENPTEVVLTLKKRPKHSLPFGRIFPQHFLFVAKASPKPLRHIGSGNSKHSGGSIKKKVVPTNDAPPPLLLPPPPPPSNAIFPLQVLDTLSSNLTETTTEDEDDDSAFLSEVDSRSSGDVHLTVPKLQVALQRRATVTGASPTTSRPPVSIDQLWRDAKRDAINRCYSYDVSCTASSQDVATLRKTSVENKTCNAEVEPVLPPLSSMSRRATCMARVDTRSDSDNKGLQKELLSSKGIKHGGSSVTMTEEEEPLTSFKSTSRHVTDMTHFNVPSENEELLGSDNGVNIGTVACKNSDAAAVVSAGFNDNKLETTSLCSTSSFQSESSAKEVINADEERTVSKSYEVVVVGGVAHKRSPPFRDVVKRSPLSSPALRHKIKRWEFASRRISCKDLGQGDCEGWLYRGFTRKGGLRSGHKWNKRWCILKANGLFVYADQQDVKAECFICLVGFSISPAPEYKSKKYAFKVYHTGTEFYFASDSQLDMSKWMNKMGLAAISYDTRMCISNTGFLSPSSQASASKSIFFSESEDDVEDIKNKCEKVVVESANNGSSTSLSSSSSYHSTLESPPPPPPTTTMTTSANAARSIQMPLTSHHHPDEPVPTQHRAGTHSTTTQTIPIDASNATESVVKSSLSGTLPHPPSYGSKKNLAEQKLSKAISLEWKVENVPSDTHSLPPGVGTSSEPPAKLSLAFEMNLDCSPPREFTDNNRRVATLPLPQSSHGGGSLQETSRSLRLSAFKLFGSPKFVKKLAGYHVGGGGAEVKPLDSRSHSMWFDEPQRATSNRTSDGADNKSVGGQPTSDKRLLSSPRLARAFFRAIHHKKAGVLHNDEPKDSPSVISGNTGSSIYGSTSDLDYRVLQSVRISSIPSRQEDEVSQRSTSSSASVSRVSSTTQSHSLSLDSVSDIVRPIVRDATRTSLKPAMGVSMIGKQRRSSSSQSSDGRSSQLVQQGHQQPQPLFASMASQGTQTDNG